MKIRLLMLAIVFGFCVSIVANDNNVNVSDDHKLTYRIAQCGDDLAPFKKIYIEVYKSLKTIRSQEQLEERFESIKQLIGTEGFEIALFENNNIPVGFMPFFRKVVENKEAAIIYDTPVESFVRERIFQLLLPAVFKLFSIQKCYCFFGSQASQEIRNVVKMLGFQEDPNAPVRMDDAIKHNAEEYIVCSRDMTDNYQCSLVENWDEMEQFKDAVFKPFFQKGGYNEEYLEMRWKSLQLLFEAQVLNIILLKNNDQPVGFLSVECKENNILLYTSPLLIDKKDINHAIQSMIDTFFPAVDTLYCIVGVPKPNFQDFLKSLGWYLVDNCPIQPHTIFIGSNPSYVIFSNTKKLLY